MTAGDAALLLALLAFQAVFAVRMVMFGLAGRHGDALRGAVMMVAISLVSFWWPS